MTDKNDKKNLQRAIYFVNYYQTHVGDSQEAHECFEWLLAKKKRKINISTDKEKIRKEIERRKNEYCNGLDSVAELYDSLLSFIDSLQEEKNRFNVGDIVRNEITDDTYTIVEILEDKYRAVLNGYSKSPIYVIPLNQGGWELVSPSSSTIGLRTKEENPFDSHIQEGDKITVNENGSRFNRSQLERVIVKQEEPVSKDLEEAAREAATWHSRNGVDRFFPNDYKKFIAGAMWQKRYDNIPQELVENYCEFIKEGGKNVCALINAVNACNAKKAECISNDLEEAAASYPSAIHMVAPQWSNEVINAFKAGAKWMEQRLKNK